MNQTGKKVLILSKMDLLKHSKRKGISDKWECKVSINFLNPMILTLILLLFFSMHVQSQRKTDYLSRGLVAVKTNDCVFLSWRKFASDSNTISYNIFRNDSLINNLPVTGKSNYTDSAGTINSIYYVEIIQGPSSTSTYTSPVNVWHNNYLTIPLQTPVNYSPNDCSVADLDGDGEFEIVVKMEGISHDNAHEGYTDPVELHAYELDGTLLWKLNLGINIRAGAHYTQFMVYDLDGDGRAELACKTAPGTKDGSGQFLNKGPAETDNDSADYRTGGGWPGFIISGPEYLTIFNGTDGKEMETVPYLPDRYPTDGWGKLNDNTNRVDRFLAGVAYLDGKNPSLVMCRGYYGRTVLVAWDYNEGSLTERWVFDSETSNNSYSGQGYHSLSVADVDNDGKDEIVYGSMCVDDDGTGLWTSGLGHGDALHVSDIDPDIPGLEVWGIHEYAQIHGSALLKAATGEIIWGTSPADVARGVSADITAEYPGMECWGGTNELRSAKNEHAGSWPSSSNFLIWWDGDLLRELLDGNSVKKYINNANDITLLEATECTSNNGSKSTPAFSGDIIGDWREEVVFRTLDNQSLRIYTTTIPTDNDIYTLLHDPQYRLALTWQNVGYNQPPHPGFFLGDGMASPPKQNIEIINPTTSPRITIIRPEENYELPLGLDLSMALKLTGIPDTSPVIIYQGNTEIDTIFKAPYFISMPGFTTGSYKITAKAKDTNGIPVTSDTVNITVDEGYPYITITSPVGTPLLWSGNDVLISAHAFDYDGVVDSVEFYLNGDLLFCDKSSPYETILENPQPNTYQLYGIVYDNLGHYTYSDTIHFDVGSSFRVYQENQSGFCGFTVGPGTIDNNHPGYTGDGFLNTENAVGSEVTWGIVFEEPGTYLATWRYGSAEQRDAEFRINDSAVVDVPFKNSGDWTIWDSTSVHFEIGKKGYYDLSLRSTQSKGLGNIDYLKIVTLNASIPSKPGDCSVDDEVIKGYPYVKIISPYADQFFTIDDSILINTETLDYDGTVDSVEFYINDNLIGIIQSGPYQMKAANPGTGIHTLYGIAYDNSGRNKASKSISFTVGDKVSTIQENGNGFCGFTMMDGTIENSYSGYTGEGYADTDNRIHSELTWAVYFPETGTYNLSWKYASPNSNNASIRINDVSVSSINFEPTADFNTWKESGYNIEIQDTGHTKISLRANQSNGLPNIDYLQAASITSTGATAGGDCSLLIGIHSIPVHDMGLKIFPSPVKDVMIIALDNKQDKIQKASVYSIAGTHITCNKFNNNLVTMNLESLDNGLYILKVESLDRFYTKKFVIN